MEKIVKERYREWLVIAFLLVFTGWVCYHTFPPVILYKLGLKKSDGIVELSGVGAALMYSLLGLVLLRVFVWAFFPGWSLKMFRQDSSWPDAAPRVWAAIILAAGLIIASAVAKASPPEHLRIALSYEGIKETRSNSGKEVDMFLASVGLRPGYSWCAAYVSYCLTKAHVKEPAVRSAMARAFVTKKSIPLSEVLSGRVHVPDGSIVVWKRGTTGSFGHVGFLTRQRSNRMYETIEGNTSSGRVGSQSDGDGVYRRTRYASLTDHFRITHFTLVT